MIPQTETGQGDEIAPCPASGEGGIRTPGPVSRTQHFQCCTIGRSVTSPWDPTLLAASHQIRMAIGPD